MNGGIEVAVLAPIGAGVLLCVFRDTWIAPMGIFGALAGSGSLLARAVLHGSERAYGFTSDPWRAGLACAAAVVAAFALLHRPDDHPYVEALHLATLGAGIASILAQGTFVFAAFLVVSTAGFAATAWATGSRAGMRAARRLALSDLCAVVGLILAAHSGVGVPPSVRGVAAWLLAAAAIARVLPDAVAAESSVLSSLAFGTARVQAFAMAAWVASGSAAHGLAIAGALVAVAFARRAIRESSAGAALCANAALALAGFGLRTPASLRAAVVLAAGTFVGAAFVVAGAEDVGAPSIGAAPLGATLVGAALVTQAAFGRALEHRIDFIVAAAALMASGWLAIAGVAGVRATARRARSLWLVVPAAGAAALAFVPDRVVSAINQHTAALIGSPRALLPAGTPAAAWIGIAFAVAMGASVLAGDGGVHAGLPAAWKPDPVPEAVGVRAVATMVLGSAFAVIVLFVIAARRGYL